MATDFYTVQNYWFGTLAEDLPSGQTYLYVEDDTDLPTEYPFILTIWDGTSNPNPNKDDNMEIVIVTADYADPGDGKLTITRGAESTTDGAHSAGDSVAMLLTAGIIQQIQTAVAALEP